MNALLIVTNPNPHSFSAVIGERFRAGLSEAGDHTVEVADLAKEGFDPRMLEEDLELSHGIGTLPDAIRREQQRVDRADALIFVFPIYWWSMPALLKGWIDRVFINGWAYRTESGKDVGILADRPVRILATGGAGERAYEKHGYRAAFAAQIEHGIFEYCGFRDIQTHLFLDINDGLGRAANLQTSFELGKNLFSTGSAPSQRDRQALVPRK